MESIQKYKRNIIFYKKHYIKSLIISVLPLYIYKDLTAEYLLYTPTPVIHLECMYTTLFLNCCRDFDNRH